MRHISISTRLAVYFVSVVVLALLFASLHLVSSLETYYLDRLDEDLEVKARMIAAGLASHLGESTQPEIERYAEITGTRVTIMDLSGRVLGDSEQDPSLMDNHSSRPEYIEALSEGLGRRSRYSSTLGTQMRYIAVPILDSSGSAIGVARVSVEVTELTDIKWTIGRRVFGTVIITCLVVALGTILVSRTITTPLRELVRAVSAVKDGHFGHKVTLSSNDEVGELGSAFNAMSEQLAKTIQEISEEKAKSEAILSSMADGVIAVDSDGRVFLFNRAASGIFGRPASAVLNRPLLEAIRNHELKSAFDDASDSGFITREMLILTPVQKHLRVHTSRLEDEQGRTGGVVGVIEDITELKRLEHMRTEFVANVSHELKTPLTAIKGFVETLLDGAHHDPDTRTRFLEIIAREGERLERLISDLLDLSSIESGRLRPSRRPLDLRQITESVFALLDPQASEKNIAVVNGVPKDLAMVKGDPDLIRQVLTNLVDNSLKYTKSGGRVSVTAAIVNDCVEVSVADNGIGIPADHLPRLFERFYRVDKARSRELGGTGLGLSIVKHIVESHGGTVRIRSKVGEGTTVTFTLPL